MKKLTVLFLLLTVCVVNAQMGPPPALDNALLKSLVGEWKGTSKSEMGDSQITETYELGLEGQFLLLNYQSTSANGAFNGMAAYTLNPESGQVSAYWIDSMRSMAEGSGKIEDKKMTLEWKGPWGTGTIAMELVNENKIMGSSKFTMQDGSVMESTSEMMRVQMTEK
jgi:hypothetical protein